MKTAVFTGYRAGAALATGARTVGAGAAFATGARAGAAFACKAARYASTRPAPN